jgi:transposase
MTSDCRFEQMIMTEAERDAFLSRVRPGISPDDYRTIEGVFHALPQIVALIERDPSRALNKLRHLLFGPKTEKTARVCPGSAPSAPPTRPPKGKRKGHGRAKAKNYTGAKRVRVPHSHLKPADPCPHCRKGTLRAQKSPSIILRIVGSAPITATAYELERLRCDACGEVFTAKAPVEAGTQKYDPSVAVIIAMMRYGSGMPHYRLARLQESMGIPMPESTQWEVMEPLSEQARPIFEALVKRAADSPLFHNDDTPMRILDLRRPGTASAASIDPERKGTFTSNILAEVAQHPVALYFTGWRHAGENIATLLAQRAADLEPPIQMCDALSCNTSSEFKTILAHCLSHGRREIVTVAASFPEESRHVLESLKAVYKVDAQAKEQGMDPHARLAHHQIHSLPVLERLETWMREQIDGKKVEPNSGFGKAIAYLRKHWKELTLFTRIAGAPLDNNACERALKKAILHRKNSLSYKTLNGARVGDLFMSLIQTCQLNRINPYEYLSAIATHAEAVKSHPLAWLPWNYPRDETTHDPPGPTA